MPKLLYALMVILLTLVSVSAGQTVDLGKKVDEAFAEVREKRFEKAAALQVFGKALFPYLEKYIGDSSEYVRGFVIALTRKQTSPDALDILARFLEDREGYIAADALEPIHNEYTCAQVKASRYVKKGLKGYLARTPNSAKAVLLLSCFGEDAEVVKLIAAKRELKGTHGDGGIHHGVPFNLSVEMALAAAENATAVAKVKAYIKEGDVKNLFFVLDNIKFVTNKELRLALVELLNDKRPVYEPVSHTNFYLRVCDLALTALSSTDPTLITMNYDKQRAYSDKELTSAYRDLKARFEKG
jgi:hypothetical protein